MRTKMLLGLAKGFNITGQCITICIYVGRGAHKQFKSHYKSITIPPRFGLLVNPMKDNKNEQKMKDRYVRTLESTQRAFSLRSGLLSSITRLCM